MHPRIPSVHSTSLMAASLSSRLFTAPDSLATRSILSTKKNGIICYIDLNKYSGAYSLKRILLKLSGYVLHLDVSSDILCGYVHSSAGDIFLFLSLITMFLGFSSWESRVLNNIWKTKQMVVNNIISNSITIIFIYLDLNKYSALYFKRLTYVYKLLCV